MGEQNVIRLDIRTDFAPAIAKLKGLELDLKNKVVARSLNEIADKTKTEAAQQIYREFNLSSKDIKSMLFTAHARPRSDDLFVSVTARSKYGRALNMIRFLETKVGKRETRRREKAGLGDRLFVKVKRQGGAKVLGKPKWASSYPFVVTNRTTGGTFIAAREERTAAGWAKYKGKLGLRSVFTVDVPSMFNTKRINARLLERVRREFPEIMARKYRDVMRGY